MTHYWEVSSPFRDSRNHFCHLLQLLRFLEPSFCARTQYLSTPDPEHIYSKSHHLFTSDPATMCSLFMYILPWLFSTCTLFIPTLHLLHFHFPWLMLCPLTHIWDSYFCMIPSCLNIDSYFCHWLLNPVLDPLWNLCSTLPETLVNLEI